MECEIEKRILRQVGVIFMLGVFYASGFVSFCVTKDNREMTVGSTWLDENQCNCLCISVNNETFSQCKECSPIKPASDTTTCVNNGWQYKENDRWMSTDEECSVCQCKENNVISCDSAKHCSNPCHAGQVPKFGPCCQVNNCTGTAYIIQETRHCIIDGSILGHGKFIIRRFHCKDKFCTCNNGEVRCFEYCELSKSQSHQFWHRLCCPRRIGNKTCQTSYNNVINPGEIHVLSDRGMICRCLDGEMYCSNMPLSSTNNLNISVKHDSRRKGQDVTTMSATDVNSTSFLVLPDNKSKNLLLIIFISLFAIVFSIGIILLLRMRYNNRHKRRGMKRQNFMLLQDDSPRIR